MHIMICYQYADIFVNQFLNDMLYVFNCNRIYTGKRFV